MLTIILIALLVIFITIGFKLVDDFDSSLPAVIVFGLGLFGMMAIMGHYDTQQEVSHCQELHRHGVKAFMDNQECYEEVSPNVFIHLHSGDEASSVKHLRG